MAQRTLVGKNYQLFIQDGASVIPIVCETGHTITASNEINTTVTKCGTLKTPQAAPDFEISGEGVVQLIDGADLLTTASAARLYELLAAQTRVTIVSGPANSTPVPGDITYTGSGFISQLDQERPADDNATFTFTIAIDGPLTQEVEPAA